MPLFRVFSNVTRIAKMDRYFDHATLSIGRSDVPVNTPLNEFLEMLSCSTQSPFAVIKMGSLAC